MLGDAQHELRHFHKEMVHLGPRLLLADHEVWRKESIGNNSPSPLPV